MIYLDNSATSPVDEEVYDAMLPYLREEYGNPSSKYYCKATSARKAVEDAREKVANLLGVSAGEIIFTAGATESTNFIIKGFMDYRRYYGDGKNHIITSKVEHKATLNVCKYLNGDIYSNNDPTVTLFGGKQKVDRGYEASFVDVTNAGEITKDSIEAAIKDNTAMVSVIYVNNEVGTINNIEDIAGLCRERDIALHVDLTQAVGKVKISLGQLGIGFASCSAHKIHGPKGVGAAVIKADAYGIQPITAFMHGGEQEQGFRAGTLAVHNIVGFGKAAETALRDFKKNTAYIHSIDEYVISRLLGIEGIRLTNPTSSRLPGIISILVEKKDFNNERFIKKISDEFALSTGSACSAGEPSHVLAAMGLGNMTSNVLRISINKYTTKTDLDHIVAVLSQSI